MNVNKHNKNATETAKKISIYDHDVITDSQNFILAIRHWEMNAD